MPQRRPTKPPASFSEQHFWHQYVSRETTLASNTMSRASLSPAGRPFAAPSKLGPNLGGWPQSPLRKSQSMDKFYSSRARKTGFGGYA